MEKRAVEIERFRLKTPLCFFTVFLIGILFISFVFAQVSDEERKKQAEEYGQNIDDFFKDIPQEAQGQTLNNNYIDDFIRGMKKDGAEKYNERLRKLADYMTKSENGEIVLHKDAKKTIWKKLRNDKEFRLMIANEARKRMMKITEEFYSGEITKFEISNELIEKLEWEGNKLGIKDENDKMKAWIDFDQLPAFVTEIDIMEKDVSGLEGGKKPFFVVTYEMDGKKLKNGFSRGGIDAQRFIMGPDGHRFGSNFLGIQSIKYDDVTGNLKVGYYNLNGELQTLDINPENLLGSSSTAGELDGLVEMLSNKYFNEFYKAKFGHDFPLKELEPLLEKITALEQEIKSEGGDDNPAKQELDQAKQELKSLPEIIDLLKDKGIIQANEASDYKARILRLKAESKSLIENLGDRVKDFKMPTSNLVNIGILSDEHDEGEVYFDFDEDGGLNIVSKKGGTAVSTNVNNELGLSLEENIDGKGGYFYFNHLGELEAVKNTKGQVGDGEGYEIANFVTEDTEGKVGVRIVRSSLVDAIDRGDWNKVVSYFDSKSELFKNALLLQDPAKIADALGVLKEQLGNKNIEVELRNRILDTVKVLEDSLVEQIGSFTTSILGKETTDKLGNDPVANYMASRVESELSQAFNKMLEPENLGKVVRYLSEQQKARKDSSYVIDDTVKKEFDALLQDSISEYDYTPLISGSIIKKAFEDLGIDSEIFTMDDKSKIENSLLKFVQENKQRFISKDLKVRETVRTELQTELASQLSNANPNDPDKVVFKNPDEIAESIVGEIARIDGIVWAQENELLERIKENLRQSQEIRESKYETNLLIDTELGEVVYSGKGKVSVDVKVPFSKISLNPDKSNKDKTFTLTSFGTNILELEGQNIKVSRKSGNDPVVNIREIVNENKPEQKYKLVSNHGSFNIIDPTKPNQVKSIINRYSGLTVTGVPIFGTIPVLLHHTDLTRNVDIEDVGLDPDAHLKFSIIGQSQSMGFGRGGFIARLVNKFANKEISSQIRSMSFSEAQYDAEMNKAINEGLEGSRGLISAIAGAGRETLKLADTNEVSVPQRRAIEDVVLLTEMLGEENNNGLKRELKPILNFIAQQGLSPGSVVEFSNNGLRFGGNSFPKKGEVATPTQEAIFRQLMREVVLLQDRLPTHVQLGMKGGNTYLTDKKGRVITIKEKKKL